MMNIHLLIFIQENFKISISFWDTFQDNFYTILLYQYDVQKKGCGLIRQPLYGNNSYLHVN